MICGCRTDTGPLWGRWGTREQEMESMWELTIIRGKNIQSKKKSVKAKK